MYVKNSNFVIYLVLAALVGFGVSFLFHSSDAQSSLLAGDISKANVYSNQKDDPESTVLEEKLQNDEEFFKATQSSLSLIENRVSDLEDLTSRTIDICSDIPVFRDAIKAVVSLNAKAHNTQLAINSANDGLKSLSNGKKAPGYEQASSNVFVGFQKIENQLAIGKAFVNTAREYLADKEGDEYKDLSDLVVEWSVYCIQDAYLNGSEDELASWNQTVNEASANSSVLSAAFTDYVKEFSNVEDIISYSSQTVISAFDNTANIMAISSEKLDLFNQGQNLNAVSTNTLSALGSALENLISLKSQNEYY